MLRDRAIAVRALVYASPRGVAMVEFALALPILVLLLVGLVDLGLGAYQMMEVSASAEAGAQYATRNPWNPTAIAAAVVGATTTSGISATPVPSQMCGCPDGGTIAEVATWDPITAKCVPAVTCASGTAPGVYAKVSAQLIYHTVLPYPELPNPLTLTSRAYRRLK